MSDSSDNNDLRAEPQVNEAVQAVLDRVLSYQAGAPVDTVRAELASGCAEIEESVSDHWLDEKAEEIHLADPAQK